MSKKIRDIIYEDLNKNEYLISIYEKIVFNNLIDTLKLNFNHKEYDPFDALKFADILSKASYVENEDLYRQWGQEIAALTLNQYNNNDDVKNYVGSVLTNLGNYQGIINKIPEYKCIDFKDKIFDEYQKDFLQIPNDNNKYFFRNQKDIYESLDNKYFSYSGKTSLGKTFIMMVKIKNDILNSKKYNYAIIVPSKSLINDIYRALLSDLDDYLNDYNYKIITSANTPLINDQNNYIFVLTPERFLNLLINNKTTLDILFVDEAHKISNNDIRSSFYYKIINMALDANPNTNIFFASPNIPNPEIYLNLISKNNINDSDIKNKIHSIYSPVNQIQYIINQTNNTISFFNQYTNKFVDLLVLNDKIDFFDFIKASLSSKTTQNLIYANKIDNVQNLATDFAKKLDYVTPNDDNYTELYNLSEYINKEIYKSLYLVDIVKKGVAYHIGNLSTSVRVKLEDLYIKNKIRTLFCTSTLIEGINLPADNLFILSYENGQKNFTDVEFKNLIGRVGRIKYNLFGNVFVVIKEKKQESKFNDLIKEKVKNQKLSISSLNLEKKLFIINNLKSGIINFDKPDDMDISDYNIIRRYAIILLKDIIDGKDTLITNEFKQLLTDDTIYNITEKFKDFKEFIEDDINTSLDQIINLNEAIKSGLEYPSLRVPNRYDIIVNFLEKLCVIFNWDKYDKKLAGNSSYNRHKLLGRHAVLLNKWFSGLTINEIMIDTINYYKNPKNNMTLRFAKNKDELNLEPSPWYKNVQYDDSIFHQNKLIIETLNDIEHIILFKLSNYFHVFSTQYKKLKKVNHIKNDWYEFVEYGTTEGLVIYLQQVGFTRETSLFIYKNAKFYVNSINGETKIKKSIFECNNESIINEAKMVYKNIRELFID